MKKEGSDVVRERTWRKKSSFDSLEVSYLIIMMKNSDASSWKMHRKGKENNSGIEKSYVYCCK